MVLCDYEYYVIYRLISVLQLQDATKFLHTASLNPVVELVNFHKW